MNDAQYIEILLGLADALGGPLDVETFGEFN